MNKGGITKFRQYILSEQEIKELLSIPKNEMIQSFNISTDMNGNDIVIRVRID